MHFLFKIPLEFEVGNVDVDLVVLAGVDSGCSSLLVLLFSACLLTAQKRMLHSL